MKMDKSKDDIVHKEFTCEERLPRFTMFDDNPIDTGENRLLGQIVF